MHIQTHICNYISNYVPENSDCVPLSPFSDIENSGSLTYLSSLYVQSLPFLLSLMWMPSSPCSGSNSSVRLHSWTSSTGAPAHLCQASSPCKCSPCLSWALRFHQGHPLAWLPSLLYLGPLGWTFSRPPCTLSSWVYTKGSWMMDKYSRISLNKWKIEQRFSEYVP